MAHITTLEELHHHISVLANVDESTAPFFSFYFDAGSGERVWSEMLDERAHTLRRLLRGNDLVDFEESLDKVEQWLDTELLPEAQGAALFIRGSLGGQFMLPMQFAAPLPNMLTVYPTPNIYHLVELKDNYHRYVVLLTMPDRAIILEVNLGASTTQAWIERSELRERVGFVWTRPHYQIHRLERGDRYLQEKVTILEKLMKAGGQTHLILAGDSQTSEQVLAALSDELVEKVIDVVPMNQSDQQSDVILATLSSFIEHEERESQAIADALIEAVRRQDLAVAGTAATLAALRSSDVDTLVMHSAYQPDPGWVCTSCDAMGTHAPETAVCPQCLAATVRPLNMKEALLRLAGLSNCPVEVVDQSSALMSLGGVGCLLRYRADSESERKRGLPV